MVTKKEKRGDGAAGHGGEDEGETTRGRSSPETRGRLYVVRRREVVLRQTCRCQDREERKERRWSVVLLRKKKVRMKLGIWALLGNKRKII